MPRRSKADAKKTREQLITVATRLFESKGYADTTVKEICLDLGITKGALFHHFKSKEDLFFEVWTRLQVGMDSEARDAAWAARSRARPYDAFLAGCKVYLKYATRQDYQKIVLIDGPAVFGLKGWYERDHDLGARNVHAGIRYLAKKGIVAEHRVDALAVMVQSSLNGAGFALARQEPGITADSVYEAFESMVKALR
ncbi:MAG: TetR/AcrR family transcriptional regulator [Hyphomonadaceae bacterium]|nr:TetR/AcrR family transcriptional regulator [Hyphomonadaceae bacterium]